MKSIFIAIVSFVIGVFFTLTFITPVELSTLPSKFVSLPESKAPITIIDESNRVIDNIITEQARSSRAKHPVEVVDHDLINEESDSFERFKRLVKQGKYQQAFDFYVDAVVDNRFRSYIFQHLAQLFEADNVEQISLIKEISWQLLNIEYNDFYYSYLYVKSSAELEQYQDAIDTVVYLKSNEEDKAYVEAVNYYYRQVLDGYTKQLLDSSDIERIEYFIIQLNYLQEEPLIAKLTQKLKEIEKSASLADRYTIKIPVQAYGPNLEHGLVDVTLNNEVTVRLMIDSGASTISLDGAAIEMLNAPIIAENRIYQTANGRISVDLVEVNSLTIGDIEIPNVAISVHRSDNPIGSHHFDGLLGRNFLNLFNWYHDTNESVLYLEPK